MPLLVGWFYQWSGNLLHLHCAFTECLRSSSRSSPTCSATKKMCWTSAARISTPEFVCLQPLWVLSGRTAIFIVREPFFQVYPLWTYSYLVLLLPVLLFTDIFLYKPVLILESLSYISVWLLLIFGRSIFSQQLGQVLYGVATSTEIAYFAYIYVKVDRSKYSVWGKFTHVMGIFNYSESNILNSWKDSQFSKNFK